MSRKELRKPKTFETTIILLALLVCLSRLGALLLPEARLWGINHLLFLPAWFSVGYAVLGLIAAALFIPSIRRRAEPIFAAIAEKTVSSPRYLIWGVIALAAGVIFWLLRMPTHFLGDGNEVILNMSQPTMTLHKWTEQGAIAFVGLIARILPFEGELLGEYAYAIVSVASGVVTVFFFFGIAYELSKDALGRLFAFGLLIASGWLLLFFGYAENYPVLWPFAAGYLYFSLRYMAGRSSLVWPSLFLYAAISLHLMAAVFLLSYPILLISRGLGARIYLKHRTICMTAAALAVIAAVGIFAYNCLHALEFRLRFLPLVDGWPKNPAYAVLSGSHLGDILNFFSLVVPLWPALAVMAARRRGRRADDPVGRFLALFSLGGLAFLLIIDPKLGMPRDWDLFALTGLGPLLYLIHRVVGNEASRKALLPGMLACAVLATTPYLATNLNEPASLEYAESVLRLDPPVAKSGMVQMGQYYRVSGMFARSDSLGAAVHRQFPEIELIQKASNLIVDGRLDEAQRVIDALTRLDPYSGELFYLRGLVACGRNDFAAAVEVFQQLSRLAPYDYAVYVNLGGAYSALGRDDSALMNFRRAYKLNPVGSDVLDELSMAFCRRQIYDSALFYGAEALAVNSDSPSGLLAVGLASANKGDSARAISCLTRYVEMVPFGIRHDQAQEALEQLQRKSSP